MFSTAVFKHYRDEFKKHNRDEKDYLKFEKIVNSLKAQVIKANRTRTQQIYSTGVQNINKNTNQIVYMFTL